MIKVIFALFLLVAQVSYAQDRTVGADHYAMKMYTAFLVQSIGETRIALDCFKRAVQQAQNEGVNPKKVILMNELFVWYRKNGVSCDFMKTPSLFRSYFEATYSEGREYTIDYFSEWTSGPLGGQYIRTFLYGIAELEAFVFGVYLTTPMGVAVGSFAGQGCFERSFGPGHSSGPLADRKAELKLFERSARGSF